MAGKTELNGLLFGSGSGGGTSNVTFPSFDMCASLSASLDPALLDQIVAYAENLGVRADDPCDIDANLRFSPYADALRREGAVDAAESYHAKQILATLFSEEALNHARKAAFSQHDVDATLWLAENASLVNGLSAYFDGAKFASWVIVEEGIFTMDSIRAGGFVPG